MPFPETCSYQLSSIRNPLLVHNSQRIIVAALSLQFAWCICASLVHTLDASQTILPVHTFSKSRHSESLLWPSMHLLLTYGLGRPQSAFSVSFFNSAHSNQFHEFLSLPSSFCLYNCPCNGFDVHVKFLAIHTISRRYKLKPPQNGNLT